MLCPIRCACEYSFFPQEFSLKRKVASASCILIGIALVSILVVGAVCNIPSVNARDPILAIVVGSSVFLCLGFALAGIKASSRF